MELEIKDLQRQRNEIECLLENQKSKVYAKLGVFEDQFWKDRQDRIIKLIGRAVYVAIFFYFLFHCISLSLNYLSADPLFRERDISRNHISFAGSWISLLIVFTLAKFPAWHFLYPKVVPFLVFFGITINATILLSMYSLPLAWRGSIVVTLIIVFVYIFSGLKPKITLISNICAGIVIYSYFMWAKVEIAGWILANTLILPNLVGLALATLTSSTEKIRFLQSKIIDYDKKIYERMNQQSLDLSQQDPLTLLGNRRGFEETLKLTIEHSNKTKIPFALLFIDIDYFKLYNDVYGHDEGDEALKRVAQTLKRNIGADDLAIRFGGEEFIVLLKQTNSKHPEVVAEVILKDIYDQKIEHRQSLIAPYLTMSIGLAIYDGQHEYTYAEVLKRADSALYMAKHLGRNRYQRLDCDADV